MLMAKTWAMKPSPFESLNQRAPRPSSSARDDRGNPLRDFPKLPNSASRGNPRSGGRWPPKRPDMFDCSPVPCVGGRVQRPHLGDWSQSLCGAINSPEFGNGRDPAMRAKGLNHASRGRLQSIAFRCAGVSAPGSLTRLFARFRGAWHPWRNHACAVCSRRSPPRHVAHSEGHPQSTT